MASQKVTASVLNSNTLKHSRIIHVPFIAITFLLFCFSPLYLSYFPFSFYHLKIKFPFSSFICSAATLYEILNVLVGVLVFLRYFFCNFFRQCFVSVILAYFSLCFIVLLWSSYTHMAFLHSYPQVFTSSNTSFPLFFFYIRFGFPFSFSNLFNLKKKIFNVDSSFMKYIWEIRWDDVKC